jgi:protein-tyrosine phosphatase
MISNIDIVYTIQKQVFCYLLKETALWEREPNRRILLLTDPNLLSLSEEDFNEMFPASTHENELLLDNDIVRFDINFVCNLSFDKMGNFPIHIGPYPQNDDDIKLMASSGITAVLNLQSDIDMLHRQIDWNSNLKSYKENGIRIERYPMFDFNPEDIVRKLKGAGDLLHQLLQDRHEVYVHCTAGMSRAAATVIIYLYIYQNMTYEDAYSFVKLHRSIICPNGAAIQQVIKNYQKEESEGDFQLFKN